MMSAATEAHDPRLQDARADMRAAQMQWASTPVRGRLGVIRELRHLISENAAALADAAGAPGGRPRTEKLVSEVLPLADACRWLERRAVRVLAPRAYPESGSPFWMRKVSFEVQRQPFGIVLVIGPGNYPLFLPAVHALHALAAGNAVALKPAPGTSGAALAFARLASKAGLAPALLAILPESIGSVREAIAAGVEKVIFTGSSENGREVLALLAETNTPSVMELSGKDAVIVLSDADLDLVVRALRFGTRLNGGQTCIAPRRLIVAQSVAGDLVARLSAARVPGLLIERVRDEAGALLRANAGDFGLGASIFSRDEAKARAIAARIQSGFVLINDLIVPTADPRMPFGGVKGSGFGATRGEDGLLEMTFPHVVAIRRGGAYPHFDEPAPDDARLFAAYIRAAHGRRRLAAMPEFFRALLGKAKRRKDLP